MQKKKFINLWYKLVARSLVEDLRVMTDNYNTILKAYVDLMKSNTFLSMNQKEQTDPSLKCVAEASSRASLQTIRDLRLQLEDANRRLKTVSENNKKEWQSDCGA